MKDELLVERVEAGLSRGRDLRRYWDAARAGRGQAQRFELALAFNRPESSYGFFDTAVVDGRPLSVMGNFQEMPYDRPKSSPALGGAAARRMRDQVREFVLRYFMRVSDFRRPQASVAGGHAPPPAPLRPLSLCGGDEAARVGFGFSQHWFKLKATGEIGRFPEEQRYAIVDLRELGRRYEWIVVKVRIYDFSFALPFDRSGPYATLPLDEESYLVLSADFVADEVEPRPGELGRFGLGYAFIKDPHQGLLAYGPGQFDAAIELIDFHVLDDGVVRVAMVFVANRPERIASVSLDPLDWALRVGEWFSLGLAPGWFDAARRLTEPLPLRHVSVDPIYTGVDLLNFITGGLTARRLCLSREQLERIFLLKHFEQHHQTLVGSLQTWRQVPDWLDQAALPGWVVNGCSS